MPHEPDHLLLRRYVDARDRGELEVAAGLWRQLAVNNFDRVQQMVKVFRFSPGGRGIPEHEHGSAASEAYLRVIAMGAKFHKREAGRFYAAVHTCVHNACMDFGRKELRHAGRAAGSLDQTFDPDGEAGPFDAALAAYDADRRERAAEAAETEHRRLGAEELVGWAIGRLANDNYREALEMTYFQDMPAEDIAEQLGITMDNLYARRSRGLKELEKILRGPRT